MKKLIIAGTLALISAGAQAAYPTMLFKTDGGAQHSIATAGLEITFSGDKLIAVSGSQKLELPVASLATMEFTDLDAAEAVVADIVSDVTVYSLDGRVCGRYNSGKEALVNLSSGVYVVEGSNGSTVKLSIRK